jgi:hypothetical protein
MITAEQFAEWKANPVTKEVFSALNKIKTEIKDQAVDERVFNFNGEELRGYICRIVGQLEGINQLLNISFNDSTEESEVSEVSGY